MMRGTLRRFTVSVLSLVAFLVAGMGDLLVRHPCPHHDALPGQHVAAGGADHSAHGASTDAPQASVPEHGEEGSCSCLQQCASNGDVPAAPSAVLVAVRMPDDARPVDLRRVHSAPLRAPTPHRLHQPNAPPLSI